MKQENCIFANVPFTITNNLVNTTVEIGTHKESFTPPQAGGNGTNSLNAAYNFKGFQFFNTYITAENAQIIDQYFDMFGYAQHKIMPIKRDARPAWTFIKTVSANIWGNMPAPALAKIKQIFNRGVTWWKDGDQLGNYNQNNKV